MNTKINDSKTTFVFWFSHQIPGIKIIAFVGEFLASPQTVLPMLINDLDGSGWQFESAHIGPFW
jgi:hypothetical protein